MALVRHVATVRGLSLGECVSLNDGLLTIDATALEAELQSRETRIVRLAVHIAQPGDATRILCTKDVIQPTVKLDGALPGEGAIGSSTAMNASDFIPSFASEPPATTATRT